MSYDVVIIGAGAAGLMAAGVAGKRGRRTLVIEHTDTIGEKIRISGGGRCNFTNLNTSPDKFISANPHFVTSALKRFTPADFIAMVDAHGIKWHEKKLGQLFCDRSAADIIDLLRAHCHASNVEIQTSTTVTSVTKGPDGFTLTTAAGDITCAALVIATGGLSIPKIGATPFGYEIAAQFGLTVIPPRAALVPLTFPPEMLADTADLSGLSVDPARATARCGQSFDEALLFTHRGLSGPAILQLSSYWETGEDITLNLAPHLDVFDALRTKKHSDPRQTLGTALSDIIPKRLAAYLVSRIGFDGRLADLSDQKLKHAAAHITGWHVTPNGHEGYRTAEVTRGGIDTAHISSKTFEVKAVPGLYFIGEVLDVTGHLGGYNFQWAWASGHAAGNAV